MITKRWILACIIGSCLSFLFPVHLSLAGGDPPSAQPAKAPKKPASSQPSGEDASNVLTMDTGKLDLLFMHIQVRSQFKN